MRKFALIAFSAFALTGCSIEDDGPDFFTHFAAVTDHDLPEFFEEGETYEVVITYKLPTACHTGSGLQLSRGGDFGDERRDIYVAGMANISASIDECNEEAEEDDLLETAKFTIQIDEDEPYTFYLWTGVDENDENVFTTVEIPVGDPELEPQQ